MPAAVVTAILGLSGEDRKLRQSSTRPFGPQACWRIEDQVTARRRPIGEHWRPTPDSRLETRKGAAEKARKLLGFSTCGRGGLSPHVSEKERGRRPFQGGFGGQTRAPRPRVADSAEGPRLRQRSHKKREGALVRERLKTYRESSTWEQWWRKLTCHRNCKNVDGVRGFDARAFSSRIHAVGSAASCRRRRTGAQATPLPPGCPQPRQPRPRYPCFWSRA